MHRTARVVFSTMLVAAAAGSAAAQGVRDEPALPWRIPEMGVLEPIRAEEFAARRRALADSLGDGVIVIFGARAPAQDYLPYQQNPALRYLTGIEEPDAALIMSRTRGRLDERI